MRHAFHVSQPHSHPHQVRTLIPKIERLIHNNGMESELLVLAGTVAINYQGKQYNIPVEVYVSEPYPDAPPRCYVRPTRDMEITMGHRHVDREVCWWVRCGRYGLIEIDRSIGVHLMIDPPPPSPPLRHTTGPGLTSRTCTSGRAGRTA